MDSIPEMNSESGVSFGMVTFIFPPFNDSGLESGYFCASDFMISVAMV